jgi:hypothetical protein
LAEGPDPGSLSKCWPKITALLYPKVNILFSYSRAFSRIELKIHRIIITAFQVYNVKPEITMRKRLVFLLTYPDLPVETGMNP